MGNSLGGKRSVKIMKTSGETFKLKAPVQAGSVLSNHPGHVLLASESVVRYGARAKPLEPHEELKPRRLYVLVDLPKLPENRGSGVNSMLRRVRSGVHMTARDRLESLKLARRSASDLSAAKTVVSIEERGGEATESGGGVRVRLRLSKAEVERLMAESKDGADVAEKIVGLCMAGAGGGAAAAMAERKAHWSGGDRGLSRQSTKSREKRVSFLPIDEGEIHLLEPNSTRL